jgi:hypothetical protein
MGIKTPTPVHQLADEGLVATAPVAPKPPKQVELPRVEVFPIAGNNPPSDPRPRKRTTKRQGPPRTIGRRRTKLTVVGWSTHGVTQRRESQ